MILRTQPGPSNRTRVSLLFALFGLGVLCIQRNPPAEARSVRPLSPLLPTLKLVGPLGGSGDDAFNALALGKDGTAYMVGSTRSRDFALAGPPRTGTDLDAVVVALRREGGSWRVKWSRRFGGRLDDEALAVAVDAHGRVVIGGKTASPNFPITSSSIQTRLAGGGSDGFVTVLDPVTALPTFSSYYGGDGDDSVRAVAVVSSQVLALGGATRSAALPMPSDAGDPPDPPGALGLDQEDGFVATLRIPARGAAQAGPVQRIGGEADDRVNALAVGKTGRIYAAGDTASSRIGSGGGGDLATTQLGDGDGFLARLSRDASRVEFAGHIGSRRKDSCECLSVLNGMVFLGGNSGASDEFPQREALGSPDGDDGFLLGIVDGSGGPRIVQSVILGGSDTIRSVSAAHVSGSAQIAIGGSTSSSELPTRGRALGDPAAVSGTEGFVGILRSRRLTSEPLHLTSLSYVSGPGDDTIATVGLTAPDSNSLLFAGSTNSWTRPVVEEAPGTLGSRGAQDGLLGAIRLGVGDASVASRPASALTFSRTTVVGSTESKSITFTNTGNSAANLSIIVHPEAPFAITPGLDRVLVIQPNETLQLTVSYSPRAVGSNTSRLEVCLLSASNLCADHPPIELSGTAVAAASGVRSPR